MLFWGFDMFRGSIVALVTPMELNGLIDIESMRALAEWQINEGTNGIVLLASTGEGPTINPGERRLVMEQVIDQVKGRVPVIVGTGTNSTERTIHLTREAMECGADACLVVVPYYNKPTQEGLYLHFSAIAEAVPIPQILYNVPSRTVCDLAPETVARLADIPNIVGLKDATGDIPRMRNTLALCGDHRIDMYSGDDVTALAFMEGGGRGVISVTANVAPAAMSKMCQAKSAGNWDLAREIQSQLMPFHRAQGVETNPIPIKWALNLMGLIPPGIRLPLTPLSERCHEVIRASLGVAGIL